MVLNDQLQVAAVQKEKYDTKQGPGVHHTPWSRVMMKKIKLAYAIAGLTGIELKPLLYWSHDLIGGVQSMQKITMIHCVEGCW